MLHRQHRADKLHLRMRPVPASSISWEKLDGKDIAALRIPALDDAGLFTVNRPLDLRVRATGDRVRLERVICHATTKQLPPNSFVELSATRLSEDQLPPPSECRILMDSVPLTILDMAATLCYDVRRKKLSRDAAVMKLVPLICEFCGSYARDYVDPEKGEVVFNLGQAAELEDVRAFFSSARGLPGIELARAAARLATDKAASPMEFLLYAAMAFPPRMGGLGIKNVLLNEPLDLSVAQDGELNHKRLTPDIRILDYPPVVEVNGKDHLEKYQVREDVRRSQDYAKLGKVHFPLSSEDVHPVSQLDKTLRSLVDLWSPYLGKNFRKRTLHILHDHDYRVARDRLISRYYPKNYDDENTEKGS